jgi:hypothetical protein
VLEFEVLNSNSSTAKKFKKKKTVRKQKVEF